MKMLIGAIALWLVATAASAQDRPAPPTTFEGWINFSGEEFQLVDSQNRYRAGQTRPCISGALPRDEQRAAAATMGRQKVRVTGASVPWSQDLPGDRLDHEGSNIRNECGGDFVILGTDIAVIQ